MNSPTRALALTSPPHVPAPGDPRWSDWLTREELAFSYGLQRAHEHLSARKAAKEAVAQLLGLPLGPGTWHAMEVRRRPGAAPTMEFHGVLADHLRSLQLPFPAVSLTHAKGHAAALAWLPVRRAEP
ncbi:holo-ACP synthase [Streptomyces sp. NPDC059010]|uniref:holo-ACP synthase n=1 Tax=Streptomyces sp. NPDC059010 TaxID=3346695 RepID=UPI003685A78F